MLANRFWIKGKKVIFDYQENVITRRSFHPSIILQSIVDSSMILTSSEGYKYIHLAVFSINQVMVVKHTSHRTYIPPDSSLILQLSNLLHHLSSAHLLIATRSLKSLSASPWANICLGKLPCGNVPLKQNIQLAICPTLRLRKSEIRPQETQEATASPEKSRFAFPVPRSRVQHIRNDDTVDNPDDVVDVAR